VSDIVKLVQVEQPFASAMLTVYVPAERSLAVVAVVSPVLQE
jgi:hypothetical protein